MEPAVSFGAWLQRRRKALDLTQEALARCVACSVATIRKIEGDERRPSRQVADLLAEVLEIPTGDRTQFLRIARGELRVERLTAMPPIPPAPVPETVKVTGTASPPTPLPPGCPPGPTLPLSPTPLIGRGAEVAELNQLLARPECRLLTVVGPGGIGKTRLALAAAQAILDSSAPDNPKSKIQHPKFPDGVYFVPLAPLSSPEYIVPAIANALGFIFSGSSEPRRQLRNYLSTKLMLIVLDNLEHLLDDIGLLAEILEQTPRVKLLVTSRERLNLQGEWIFDLQGLPVPPDGQVEQLAEYSAVTLFVESAQRVSAGFALTEQNQQAIVRICRLVEGMPLGIELAAAWTPMLSCQEIAQEIERNLDFLMVARRDLSERQRSLRATFDHSWKLLSEEERRAMRQLSVFRGGFPRAAADHVAGASLALLAALVAKSLVRRTAQGGYEIHELMRQYAAGHLSADAQDEQTARDRHAAWYLTLLQQNEADLQSSRQQATRDQLASELDNLRLAWAWATTQGPFRLLRQAAPALWYLYWLLQLHHEGDTVFQRAVEGVQARSVADASGVPAQQAAVLGVLLSLQAWLHFLAGHGGEARTLSQRGILLLRQSDDHAGLAHALMLLGSIDHFQGAWAEAKASRQECIALSRALGRVWNLGICYGGLGLSAHEQGAHLEAQQWFTQALEFLRQAGDPRYIAFTLINLSLTKLALGQYLEAKQLLKESGELANRLGDQTLIPYAQEYLGLVAFATHELDEAYQIWLACLAKYQRASNHHAQARTSNYLGWVSLDLGQTVESQHYFSDALRIAGEIEMLPVALEALVGVAVLQAQASASERALELASYVFSHPAGNQEAKERAKRLRTELIAHLTPQQIEAAYLRAQAMTLEEAITLTVA